MRGKTWETSNRYGIVALEHPDEDRPVHRYQDESLRWFDRKLRSCRRRGFGFIHPQSEK